MSSILKIMKINNIIQPVIWIIVAILMTQARAQEAVETDGQSIASVEENDPPIMDIMSMPVDGDETRERSMDDYRQDVLRYAEEILRLETANGAYNNELIEELVGLGLAYNNLGEHTEALNVFNRALHINRVNEGLQNLNQLPILELIIETNTLLNDYDELNKNYSYLLWVNDRNYAPDDMRRVPAYTRAANWHMDAYDITEPPKSIQHLILAANFYSKAADIIEAAKGEDSPELINPLYGIVNANFKLVEPFGFVANIDTFISGKLNPLMPSNFDSEYDEEEEGYPRNTYRALDYSPEHLSRIVQEEKYTFSMVQNSYKSGRNALLRIIDIHEKNPDLPRLSYAYALTHMGDWYLRFYKRSYALRYYESAFNTLMNLEYGDVAIQTLFGRPRSLGTFEEKPEFEFERYKVVSSVEISDEDDEQEGVNLEELNDSKYVLVQFRVTKYGAVRNLEILAANPEDNVRFRRMARNTINSTPFRPRMENGQPIRTENVKMLYRFQ